VRSLDVSCSEDYVEDRFSASLWSISRPFGRTFSYTGGASFLAWRARRFTKRHFEYARHGRAEPYRISRLAVRRSPAGISHIFFVLIASSSTGSRVHPRIRTRSELPRRSDVIRIISTCAPRPAAPLTCQPHASRVWEREGTSRAERLMRASNSKRFDCCGERRINFHFATQVYGEFRLSRQSPACVY